MRSACPLSYVQDATTPTGRTRVTQKLVPLISEMEIKARVKELAASISDHYRGKDTVLLGVLKGGLVFMADIMRLLDIDYECELVRLSSYGNGMDSSGRVSFVSGLTGSIKDRHVLVIDCVVDTGLTLEFLTRHLRMKDPSSLRTCVLLNKLAHRHSPAERGVHLNYVGFNIPDRFVVGYGLDWAEKYRGLPYIAYLGGQED